MVTRALIARQINGREVEYLYSHWDNYLEGSGVILQEHYSTKEKVDELFAKNRGINFLAKSIESTRFYESEGDAIRRCPLNFLNTRADGCCAEYIYVFTLKGEWKFKEFFDCFEWFGWTNYKSLEQGLKLIMNEDGGK